MKTKSKFSDEVLAAHLRGVSGYNEKGEEIPDPTPLEVPIGCGRPDTFEDIRKMLRREVMDELNQLGVETFDEADDFDMEDEDMSSPWEEHFDHSGQRDNVGDIWTRENEIRAGLVTAPDYERAKAIIRALESEKLARETKGKEGQNPAKEKTQ